jgi:hypothetical protein
MSPFPLTSTSLLDYSRYLSLLSGNSAYNPSSFDLLESIVLTGSQSSIEFTNISANYSSLYQHLQVRMVALHSADQNGRLRINGDTSGNYNWHQLAGNGSGVSSFGTSDSWMQIAYGPNSTTVPTVSVIDILDPFETTKFKTTRVLTGSASSTNNVKLMSGLWRSTSQITSLNFAEVNGGYQSGTRISLYGMKVV